MSDEMIVRYCSPTLANIKTANLFSCLYRSRKTVINEIRSINQKLVPKGIRVLPIHMSERRVLVYVYRPERLKKDLSDSAVQRFLKTKGYPCENFLYCINRLIVRLRSEPDFPHEIGLFLGYPLADVIGFIENRAVCSKCSGCWKVYGNEQEALEIFEQYQKCAGTYYAQWKKGITIEQLAVNSSL